MWKLLRILVLVNVAVIAAAASTSCAEEAGATPGRLSFPVEYVWRKVFSLAERKRAFAFAGNGAFGLATGLDSQDEADRLALEKCTERSKYIALRNPPAETCQILSRGSTWAVGGLQPDPQWQQPLPGKDRPMQKGRKVVIPGGKSKGIVLLVHGCNGLGAKIFTDVWGAYFNALGLDLYAPDSFAVKRPKDVCGSMVDYPIAQVSEVWRLRVAQTQRTLADLRKANPGKPIYLFGHSEGGLIVQMVEAEVDGIIVSGEECGVMGAPIAAPPRTPLLYLWGEYDQYVNGLGLFRVTNEGSRNCDQVGPKGNMTFRILAGRGHIPWPWTEDVNVAIANFVASASPHRVAEIPLSAKARKAWKRVKPDRNYRKAKPHRAAAINTAGTSYMVWGLDNAEDARQLALFGCDFATARKANVFRTGKHLCAVVDVNGAPP